MKWKIENKCKASILLLIVILSLSFSTALNVNIPQTINYSNIVINETANLSLDSELLQGLTPQQVANLYVETDDKAYNGTLAFNSSLSNYYLNSNPFNFYNSTTIPAFAQYSFGSNNFNGSGNFTTTGKITTNQFEDVTSGLLTHPTSIGTNVLGTRNLRPRADAAYDFGSSTSRYRDLFLSRNLSDGTYSITISNINAKADYQFLNNNFNGTGNFTTTGTGSFGLTKTSKIRSSGAVQAGNGLMAMGSDAYAYGYDSFVVGFDSSASGSSSIVLGEESTASNYGSIALGIKAKVSEQYGVAIGYNSVVNGRSSVALTGGSADGLYSTAIGTGSNTHGSYGIAMGVGVNTLTNSYILSFGKSFSNNVSQSFAVGFGQKDFEVSAGKIKTPSSIQALSGENITFYNSTGNGYANLNAKSFNVFSPKDLKYTKDYLKKLPSSNEVLDSNGKLNKEFTFKNEIKENSSIFDLSKPIYIYENVTTCVNVSYPEFKDDKRINQYKTECSTKEEIKEIKYEIKYEDALDIAEVLVNNRKLITELNERVLRLEQETCTIKLFSWCIK